MLASPRWWMLALGCATFWASRHIIPSVIQRLFPFCTSSDRPGDNPDIIAESSIDLDGTLRVADQYKGLICGIKARHGIASPGILGGDAAGKRAAAKVASN
jgi:hypothetical protein